MLKYFTYMIMTFTAFSAGWIFNNKNYVIQGKGEGAIMFSPHSGEAWVLEIVEIPSSFSAGHSLNCEKDFCGLNGLRYNWVPTTVSPCYTQIVVGRNPEEAKNADEKALRYFDACLKREK